MDKFISPPTILISVLSTTIVRHKTTRNCRKKKEVEHISKKLEKSIPRERRYREKIGIFDDFISVAEIGAALGLTIFQVAFDTRV